MRSSRSLVAATIRTLTWRSVRSDPTGLMSPLSAKRRSSVCIRSEHLAELVEKQRALVRRRGQARLVPVRAREAAAHMAEQLGFEQRVGHAGTVDRDEASQASTSCRMNEPGDDLFADSGFADHEHVGVASSGGCDVFPQTLHLAAVAQEQLRRGNRGLIPPARDGFLWRHGRFVCWGRCPRESAYYSYRETKFNPDCISRFKQFGWSLTICQFRKRAAGLN